MALRLPTIQRRTVENLAQQDPYGPVRVANARADALSKWGQAGEAATELYKMYSDREKQESVREAILAVHTADSQFRSTYGSQEEYRVNEINDENFLELSSKLGEGEIVPAHKVYAEWRSRNYEAAVRDAAAGIKDPTLQKNFLTEQEMTRMSFYAVDSENATKDQIRYVTQKDLERMKEATLKRDYTTARLVIGTSSMPDEAKQRALLDIDTTEQFDYFYEVIGNRNLTEMKLAYSQLEKNDPKYTSRINPKDRKELMNELRVDIAQEDHAINAALDARRTLQKDDLRNQIRDMWEGRKTDSRRMRLNLAAIGDSDPVLAQEAEWTMELQPKVYEILRQPREGRINSLNELKAIAKTPKTEYFVRKLETAIDATDRALKNDAVKWAQDTGFTRFAPLDMRSPRSIAKSLQDRLPGIVALQRTQRAFTGFGTDEEMLAFGNVIENASTNEQLEIFGGVSRALGDYAAPLYEQLKNKGISKTAAIAGQLYALGPQYHEVSKMILNGSKIRRENPVVQKQIQDAKLDHVIVDKFGYVFAGNPTHQGLMAEAFKDVWAAGVKDADRAFKLLVGDTITLGEGSVIQAPVPGMTARQYRKQIESLPDRYWDIMAKQVHGYSAKDLRKGFVDGGFTQIGVENKGVILKNPKGYFVTLKDGKTPFVFRLDMALPTAEEAFQNKLDQIPPTDKAKIKAKQKEAEEFMKKHPGATKRDYEEEQVRKTPGMTIFRGFTP